MFNHAQRLVGSIPGPTIAPTPPRHTEQERPVTSDARPHEHMSEEKTTSEVSTYGKDTPAGRPDIDGRAAVFVPSPLFDLENSTTIRKGAGVVGYGNPDGSLTVYFEANRFDDSSLHKWEHKVRKAYERMVMGAPTVSKAKIDACMLEQVGIVDGMGITIRQPERLQHWLTRSNALDTAPSESIVLWRTK